jgi:predicted dehydrogenase
MVTFMKAKELLAQEAIGKPESFAVNAFSSDFCGVRGKPQVSNGRGGVLGDLGSYAVDLVLWFFGDVQVSSTKIESLTGAGAEDAAYFTVERESDILHGAVSVSWCMEGYRMPEVALVIKGSRGTMEVNDDRVCLNLNGGGRSVWFRHSLDDHVGFWLGAPEYYREDAYFVNSVITGSFAEPSFKTASKVDLFLDAIRQKAERT